METSYDPQPYEPISSLIESIDGYRIVGCCHNELLEHLLFLFVLSCCISQGKEKSHGNLTCDEILGFSSIAEERIQDTYRESFESKGSGRYNSRRPMTALPRRCHAGRNPQAAPSS